VVHGAKSCRRAAVVMEVMRRIVIDTSVATECSPAAEYAARSRIGV
jgi:hypothetical protein